MRITGSIKNKRNGAIVTGARVLILDGGTELLSFNDCDGVVEQDHNISDSLQKVIVEVKHKDFGPFKETRSVSGNTIDITCELEPLSAPPPAKPVPVPAPPRDDRLTGGPRFWKIALVLDAILLFLTFVGGRNMEAMVIINPLLVLIITSFLIAWAPIYLLLAVFGVVAAHFASFYAVLGRTTGAERASLLLVLGINLVLVICLDKFRGKWNRIPIIGALIKPERIRPQWTLTRD